MHAVRYNSYKMKTASPITFVQTTVKSAFNQLARLLNFLSGGKLHPNMVTMFSFLGHVPIVILIATNHHIIAGLLLIVFGLMDTLDGALARLQNRASNKGMFLDSVTDRIKEVMLYIGIAYFFVSYLNPKLAVWAVAACGISVAVSYLNAWGEVVTANLPKLHVRNSAFRSGLMSYDVRMFCLVVGLLFGVLEQAVIIIAVLSSITVLQRFNNVYKRL